MTRAIVGEGTPEAAWADWGPLAALPLLEAPTVPRVVVVAPHPDDEVLGAGGIVALLAGCGAHVEIVALTDGEGSHHAAGVEPGALARRRTVETAVALRRLLGLVPLVSRLGLPDGGLAEAETTMTTALAARLRSGDWCLAPYHEDGHPDHEAAGRAAARACAATGARLLEYPIWLWHWSRPGDRRVPWMRARRIGLPPEVRARKRHAIAAFRTQIEPLGRGTGRRTILPAETLAHFSRPFEVLFA